MGKKLIIIVAFLTLVGCATRRYKAYDINKSNEVESTVSHKVNTTSIDYKHSLDSLLFIRTFKFEIYDTEHPDSLGNYPLKVYGESVTKATNVTESQETREESSVVDDTISYKSKDVIVEHSEKEAKTKFRSYNFLYLFVIAIIFVLLYKYRKK